MNRQIGIYMSPADEMLFASERVIERGGCFCRPSLAGSDDLNLLALPLINTKPPKGVLYYIRPQVTADDLVLRTFAAGHTLIDKEDSQIVEFERSRVIDGVCYAGRLWYTTDRKDGTAKPEPFLHWVETLFSWVRANYRLVRKGQVEYYAGVSTCQEVQSASIVLS